MNGKDSDCIDRNESGHMANSEQSTNGLHDDLTPEQMVILHEKMELEKLLEVTKKLQQQANLFFSTKETSSPAEPSTSLEQKKLNASGSLESRYASRLQSCSNNNDNFSQITTEVNGSTVTSEPSKRNADKTEGAEVPSTTEHGSVGEYPEDSKDGSGGGPLSLRGNVRLLEENAELLQKKIELEVLLHRAKLLLEHTGLLEANDDAGGDDFSMENNVEKISKTPDSNVQTLVDDNNSGKVNNNISSNNNSLEEYSESNVEAFYEKASELTCKTESLLDVVHQNKASCSNESPEESINCSMLDFEEDLKEALHGAPTSDASNHFRESETRSDEFEKEDVETTDNMHAEVYDKYTIEKLLQKADSLLEQANRPRWSTENSSKEKNSERSADALQELSVKQDFKETTSTDQDEGIKRALNDDATAFVAADQTNKETEALHTIANDESVAARLGQEFSKVLGQADESTDDDDDDDPSFDAKFHLQQLLQRAKTVLERSKVPARKRFLEYERLDESQSAEDKLKRLEDISDLSVSKTESPNESKSDALDSVEKLPENNYETGFLENQSEKLTAAQATDEGSGIDFDSLTQDAQLEFLIGTTLALKQKADSLLCEINESETPSSTTTSSTTPSSTTQSSTTTSSTTTSSTTTSSTTTSSTTQSSTTQSSTTTSSATTSTQETHESATNNCHTENTLGTTNSDQEHPIATTHERTLDTAIGENIRPGTLETAEFRQDAEGFQTEYEEVEESHLQINESDKSPLEIEDEYASDGSDMCDMMQYYEDESSEEETDYSETQIDGIGAELLQLQKVTDLLVVNSEFANETPDALQPQDSSISENDHQRPSVQIGNGHSEQENFANRLQLAPDAFSCSASSETEFLNRSGDACSVPTDEDGTVGHLVDEDGAFDERAELRLLLEKTKLLLEKAKQPLGVEKTDNETVVSIFCPDDFKSLKHIDSTASEDSALKSDETSEIPSSTNQDISTDDTETKTFDHAEVNQPEICDRSPETAAENAPMSEKQSSCELQVTRSVLQSESEEFAYENLLCSVKEQETPAFNADNVNKQDRILSVANSSELLSAQLTQIKAEISTILQEASAELTDSLATKTDLESSFNCNSAAQQRNPDCHEEQSKIPDTLCSGHSISKDIEVSTDQQRAVSEAEAGSSHTGTGVPEADAKTNGTKTAEPNNLNSLSSLTKLLSLQKDMARMQLQLSNLQDSMRTTNATLQDLLDEAFSEM